MRAGAAAVASAFALAEARAAVGLVALGRVRTAVRRRGLTGSMRVLATRGSRAVFLREVHLWYALDLEGRLPRPMPPGIELVRARDEDVDLLGGLPTLTPRAARERRAGGAELWLALEGPVAAFACWIFPERAPVLAALGGWLELPAGTVCLEDSVTSPAHRGRGVAPAAWEGIAAAEAIDGHALLTKVAEDNAPSRRAVEKAGFREIAVMRLARSGPRTSVRVEVLDSPLGRALAERLARRR